MQISREVIESFNKAVESKEWEARAAEDRARKAEHQAAEAGRAAEFVIHIQQQMEEMKDRFAQAESLSHERHAEAQRRAEETVREMRERAIAVEKEKETTIEAERKRSAELVKQNEIAIVEVRRHTEELLREKEVAMQAMQQQRTQLNNAVSEAERIAQEIASQSNPSPQNQIVGAALMDTQDDYSPAAASATTLGAQGSLRCLPCNIVSAAPVRVNVIPMDTGSDSTTLGAQGGPSDISGTAPGHNNDATPMYTQSDSIPIPETPGESPSWTEAAPRHTSGTIPAPKYPPGRHRAQGRTTISTVSPVRSRQQGQQSQQSQAISETSIMDKLNFILEHLNQAHTKQHKNEPPSPYKTQTSKPREEGRNERLVSKVHVASSV